MKIECTVDELKEMLKETPSEGTLDVGKSSVEIIKEALNQALHQELSIQIDTESPSLIELINSLKKK